MSFVRWKKVYSPSKDFVKNTLFYFPFNLEIVVQWLLYIYSVTSPLALLWQDKCFEELPHTRISVGLLHIHRYLMGPGSINLFHERSVS